jgi:hypothetical protein
MLDRRGNWRMRDEAAQASGAPGTPIRHEALLGFINRNYDADDRGQWFFQNGPQRVYIELGYTPWVVRLSADAAGGLALTDQAGGAFEPWILFVDSSTPPRVAVLHDHDLEVFSDHAALGDDSMSGAFRWNNGVVLPLQGVQRDEVAARFGFVDSPAASA